MKNNFEKEIEKILKEMDKDKQRIIAHPFLYNKYKEKFEEIKKQYFVTIFESSLIPIDKIYVFDSEKNIEKDMIKSLPII